MPTIRSRRYRGGGNDANHPSQVKQVRGAALWIRVSTSDQHPENQEPVLRRLVGSRGLPVVRVYLLDANSAWKGAHEPQLAAALADARSGQFSHFVFWALDRLSREGPEASLRVIREFEEAGVTAISAQEDWLETSADNRDLLISVYAHTARADSKRKSERTKAGRARLVREGKWPGGKPPYGYTLVDGVVEIDESAADIVRLIYRLYTSGRKGVRAIQREMSSRGIPTPTGDARWAESKLHTILSDATYYQGRHSKTSVPVPRIISDDLWREAERIRARNRRLHPPRVKPWPLQGIIFCGVCGSTWRTDSAKSGYRRYYCKGRESDSRYHVATGHYCQIPRQAAMALEFQVFMALMIVLEDPKELAKALQSSIDDLRAREKDLSAEYSPIEDKLADTDAELDRLAEAWAKGWISRQKFEKLRSQAEDRRSLLLARRSAMDPNQLSELEKTRFLLERTIYEHESLMSGGHASLSTAIFSPELFIKGFDSDPERDLWEQYAESLRYILERLQAEIVAFENRFEIHGTINFQVPSTEVMMSDRHWATQVSGNDLSSSTDHHAFSSGRGSG